MIDGELRLAGYVEASHGCAHRCRHCPVPAVYDGRIRIVDVDTVLRDIGQQADLGARHPTIVDPAFLYGSQHSLWIIRAVHKRFPDQTSACPAMVTHIIRDV